VGVQRRIGAAPEPPADRPAQAADRLFAGVVIMMKRWIAGLLALVSLGAQGQQAAEGEVRKIDKAAGKITLQHGEIKSLDLPPMHMAFSVQDPALLDRVKVGDKVSFTAAKIHGAYTITAITPRSR
jgi:Cu(I)/Ag(I) efflux system periplasmic protein CusF